MPKQAARDEARITTVAIGFRVKSGWATAVLLAGPASGPTVLERRRVELSDPKTPMSYQPYHAGIGHAAASGAVVARLIRIVGRCAATSFDALLRSQDSAGRRVRGIGIVVGSTVDPASIANPHIRAHAAEGQLFRRVLERAARRHRLPATTLRERELYATVAQALGHPPAHVRSAVALVGRHLGAPWGADEKAAAAAAWLALGHGAAIERGG